MFVFIFWGKVFTALGFKTTHKKAYSWETEETEQESVHMIGRRLMGCISISMIIGFFIFGCIQANNPDFCRVRKFADAVITFPYAIGCNLFKDRYDIHLN